MSVDRIFKSDIFKSKSKRVKMIFSVMASPDRVELLRILHTKGPLTYSELKGVAGFMSKKDSGKFAYHLRKLIRQSLVLLNKSEKRYCITNLGKLIVNLARQVEEHSIIESGRMQVRTSHNSFEDFNSYKITQSLVREGNLPLELAQQIAEDVESRVYKYRITYLTGSIIREFINYVLTERGYEEYRNKFMRIGLPLFDMKELVSKLEKIPNGAEGLQLTIGQKALTDYTLFTILTSDIVDLHLSGDLHVSDPGFWQHMPDTIFVDIRLMLGHTIKLGGKYLDVSRIQNPTKLEDISTSLSMVISLLAREASKEVIIDGIASSLASHVSNPNLVQNITNAFVTASTVSKYKDPGGILSIRLDLNSKHKETIIAIIRAHRNYVKITPIPRIGLVINYDKGKSIATISDLLSETVMLGGRISFTNGHMSSIGLVLNWQKTHQTTSIALHSLSINLPRLAFESNKDVNYFRARLTVLIRQSTEIMMQRKKGIADCIQKGLHPILSQHIQHADQNSISLFINLVGLKEAVFGILGYDNNNDQKIIDKVVTTAVDACNDRSKDLNVSIFPCMIDSDSPGRFMDLDNKKYGKKNILFLNDTGYYSQGVRIHASDILEIADGIVQSESIIESNKLSKLFTGGLSTTLLFDANTTQSEIKTCLEKMSKLVSQFRPVKKIIMCHECGFKDKPFVDKCPKCNASLISTR